MIKNIACLSFAIATISTYAQFPEADIWQFDLEVKNEEVKLSNPKNLTARPGYDNQPSYSADGTYFLYTSYRDNQSDIYKYDLVNNKVTQLTNTPESEFSPTITPDGKYFSVVRVEKDSSQRLWKFPLAGGEPLLLTPKIDSIGYHQWVSNNELLFFVLTKPFTLQLCDLQKQTTIVVADSIGRCTKPVAGKKNMFSFTRLKDTAATVWHYKLKKKVSLPQPALKLNKGEDYIWYDKKQIIATNENEVILFNVKTGKKFILNVATFNIQKITRIALHPQKQKLLLVVHN